MSLHATFKATLDIDPEVRQQAEARLQRARSDPNTPFECLEFVALSDVPIALSGMSSGTPPPGRAQPQPQPAGGMPELVSAMAPPAAAVISVSSSGRGRSRSESSGTRFSLHKHKHSVSSSGASLDLQDINGGALNPSQTAASSSESYVVQAAAVYLKNLVFANWSQKLQKDDRRVFAEVAQRELFKERLLQSLCSVKHRSVLPYLTSILYYIITNDYPHSWPKLVPAISRLFEQSNPALVYSGVLCLLEVFRYYRWQLSSANRSDLEQLVAAFFPKLLGFSSVLIRETDDFAGEMQWKINKVYKLATTIDLVPFLQQRNQLEKWVSLFLRIGELDYRPAGPDSDVMLLPWMKCKKWAMVNINTLMLRYSLPVARQGLHDTFFVSEYAQFGQMFVHDFAPEICRVYINQLKGIESGLRFLCDHNKRSMLLFFEACVHIDDLWNGLLSEMELILTKLLFNTLRLTKQDLEMFDVMPEEFLLRHATNALGDKALTETVESSDVLELGSEFGAAKLLKSMSDTRTSAVIPGLLMFVNQIIDSPASELDSALNKDAALRIVCIVFDAIDRSPDAKARIDDFIDRYVLPAFNTNRYPFLKARVCELIARCANVDFKMATLQSAYSVAVEASNDPCVVTAVQGIAALRTLARFPSIFETHKAYINDTMTKILKLTNETDSDILTEAMDEFVEVYSEQLIPFAQNLCARLVKQYLKTTSELLVADYIDDKLVTSAQSTIGTIISLLIALADYPDKIRDLTPVVEPVIVVGVEHPEIDLYMETFELIDTVITSAGAVDMTMGKVLETLHKVFQVNPNAYPEELVPCILTFIQYGRNLFNHSKFHVDIVYSILTGFLSNYDRTKSYEDEGYILEVLSALMVMFLSFGRGSLDHLIAPVLRLSCDRVSATALSTPKHIKSYVDDLGFCVIYYNPTHVVQNLSAEDVRRVFEWILQVPSAERQCSRKVRILTILRLVTVSCGPVDKEVIGLVYLRAMIAYQRLRGEIKSESPPPTAGSFQFVFVADERNPDAELIEAQDEIPLVSQTVEGISIDQFYRQTMSWVQQNNSELYTVLITKLGSNERLFHEKLMAGNIF
ncbi:hypothetical protein TRVA0_060S00232 [Trichomonascus vanleenenianus]|uniref:uncharacterized protein n=1 Tax=Trichomonascus vanleenenianus TaxID=2268995 RepID=UPI003EC9A501